MPSCQLLALPLAETFSLVFSDPAGDELIDRPRPRRRRGGLRPLSLQRRSVQIWCLEFCSIEGSLNL